MNTTIPEIRSVFITGLAAGVGARLARMCLDRGISVYGCDRDKVKLDQIAEENEDRDFTVYHCDITHAESLRKVFAQACEISGGIDALVNNAGVYLGQPISCYDAETTEYVIATNLKAPLTLSLHFADQIKSRGTQGSIVNIASVAGEVGSSDAVYGAVKAGVIGLTKSNAMNFAPYVRVNAVSPGLITDTEIAAAIPDYRYEEYKRQELLDDDLTTDAVADVALFLIGHASRSLTGAILRSDNGSYPR